MFISHLQVLQNILTNSKFKNNTIFTTVKMVAPQGTTVKILVHGPWWSTEIQNSGKTGVHNFDPEVSAFMATYS